MASADSKTKAKTNEKTLVIVESPAKAKSIGKFLGSRYKVVASVGHVRDLPKSTLGIDVDHGYEPKYITIKGKGPLIKDLKKEAKTARRVMLATDPDREGEAISWHLAHILGIDESDVCRIEFHEITKDAIKNAAKNPRTINMNLVDAQQARRVLDRLVGYQISPLLWRKIRWGLSAGRVQSAALKIICDKERVIQAFVPEEYWPIIAVFHGDSKVRSFEAKLAEMDGKKITVRSEEEANGILEELKKGGYRVSAIDNKKTARKPLPPFTTSTLQQEASSKLGFLTRRTMFTAQQLYEGIDIKGEGTVGLVSYIRTDSVRVSEEARAMARDFIIGEYGPEYYASNYYKNRKKDVQDAHEAIRPTSVARTPESIKDSLTRDQFNLYRLIWCRFVASQMEAALYDVQNVAIQNGRYTFRASGSRVLFDGFRKVYEMKEDGEVRLPSLEQGQDLKEKSVKTEQRFTQPPARFTEASLIKQLEEQDIGRPSTYAPIVSTLLDRKYVRREKKSLIPTELGFTVTELMETYFRNIVDAGFTAQMEDKLDSIETDGNDWRKIIDDFYGPFQEELQEADRSIEKIEVKDEPTGELCEVCGKPMVLKHGRFGDFIACSGYPECKNTKPIVKKIGVACPECGKDIVERKSRKGRTFYGCSGYPECKFVSWDKPVDRKCPKCGSIMVEKNWKSAKYACSNRECGYREKE
ncbi:MAG: type I DNA topoisomerase [Firmicutes bacterium]|nr:type I DNA topoisomerase [Bacillota bacterium]